MLVMPRVECWSGKVKLMEKLWVEWEAGHVTSSSVAVKSLLMLSSEAILPIQKICQQAELDSIELLQHCVYPEWTGLRPAGDTAGVVSYSAQPPRTVSTLTRVINLFIFLCAYRPSLNL